MAAPPRGSLTAIALTFWKNTCVEAKFQPAHAKSSGAASFRAERPNSFSEASPHSRARGRNPHQRVSQGREGRCRVIEYRVSALWELAGARMEEKSAGERWRKVVGAHRIWRSAQRHRRIVASCQHDRMRPFLEGLSVGRRFGVATPAGHGLQGKSPWMRRRRSSQLRQQL